MTIAPFPRLARVLGTAAIAVAAFPQLQCGDAASAAGAGGAAASSGSGAEVATTVDVSIIGVGEVTVAGKSTNESCARDSKGQLSGSCGTQWAKGDAPKLTAKETDADSTFSSWTDTDSGETLGSAKTFQAKEGDKLRITALFLPKTSTTASTGTCGGGACGCVNDVCPDVVAEGIDSLAGLVEQGDDLFYIGSIHKLAKSGGTPVSLIGAAVSSFAVDATSIYWIDGSATSLSKNNLDGTGGTVLTSLDGVQYPHSIAIDDTDVYYTALITKPAGDCTAVRRVPKAGGPSALVAEACDFASPAKPYALALNATDVVWGTITQTGGGSLYRATKATDNGPAIPLASSMNAPVTRVVVDGTVVFYMQNGIRRLDTTNPSVITQVGTSMTNIATFTADPTAVYVTGSGGVSKVDRATEKETLLANDPGLTIAVDATSVYWGSGNAGMMKVLKIGI